MDEMNQMYTQYEQPQVQPQVQPQAQPPKKKNKIPGWIILILGLCMLGVGLAVIVLGSHANAYETEDPVDVVFATEEDEYVYTYVQYMTDYVASYAAMGNMQIYIAFDSEWYPSIICLHTDDLPKFQPYIDWMFSDSYENGPEEMTVTGYAQLIDDELKQYIVEAFTDYFGETDMTMENCSDWFGEYYLQVGEKNSTYGTTNIGIYLLLAAVVLIVIGGVMIYEKPQPIYTNGPIIQQTHRGLGILGALAGALLGGLLWAIVNALGYISGWIGCLIILFAYIGYKLLSHKEDLFGVIISVVFGLLTILPATYLAWGWSYYNAINESMPGYTSLWRALLELPAYLTEYGEWGSLASEIVVGYAFVIVVGIMMIFRKKK